MRQKRQKIPRNSPCPCDSGKKYKRCCWNKNFDWVESDDGTLGRSVPIPPELVEILKEHRQRFIEVVIAFDDMIIISIVVLQCILQRFLLALQVFSFGHEDFFLERKRLPFLLFLIFCNPFVHFLKIFGCLTPCFRAIANLAQHGVVNEL